MQTEFDTLFETMLDRYQQGGFSNGDRVVFKKDCLKLDFFKGKASQFIDLIRACMAPGFDKNLRIAALKSIYPTTTQNYNIGTETPDCVYADVVIEINPGLYHSPMTVPVEALEVMRDEFDPAPYPDSMIKPNKEGDEKNHKTKSTHGEKPHEVNLANQNTTLPGGKKWDDKKPGSGVFKSKAKEYKFGGKI